MNDYFDDHICTNCGYQGPAKGVDTCPECASRMMSMKDLGRYDDDEAHAGLDGDEAKAKGLGPDVESFEDLRDEEDDDEDDDF